MKKIVFIFIVSLVTLSLSSYKGYKIPDVNSSQKLISVVNCDYLAFNNFGNYYNMGVDWETSMQWTYSDWNRCMNYTDGNGSNFSNVRIRIISSY